MKMYEIVMGVVLLVAAVVLIVVTLCQHSRGQGLAGVINGNTHGMNAGASRNDQMLSRLTMIAGGVLFVIAIVACAIFSRMG